MYKIKNKKGEEVRIKDNLRVYWELGKPYKWLFIGIFILILISRVSSLAEKFIFKNVIDQGAEFVAGEISREYFISNIFIMAWIFLGTIIVISISRYISSTINFSLDANMTRDLRMRFFNHIVGLSKSFHDSNKTGSLISRLQRGANAIERTNDFFLHSIALAIIEFILVGGSLLLFDVTTAVAVFIMAFIFVAYSLILIREQQPSSLMANYSEDREKGLVADVFTNIDSVKYFGKENPISIRYKGLVDDARIKRLKHWSYYRKLEVGQHAIISIGTMLVIMLPILKLLSGEITIGTLAFIYATYGSLVFPLYSLVGGLRSFYKGIADFDSLFEYNKIENEIKDKKNAGKLKVKYGNIEFRDVSFKYKEKSKRAVKNLNLIIKPNEKVALVGHSGSGKTTLIKLLYRLYNLDGGKILIDGKDIKYFKQNSLRGELSIVPQEPILFDDTIYNNIKFSNPKAKRTDVLKAMRFSQLDKFVKNLPKKENTIVGERGVKLSGGEKQRVSIARAILANKKILVLDEATSALDSHTEYEIQKDLKKLMEGRTSIIIAHRLSTIMRADKIVVINRGRIVQIGKHRELIEKPGIYKKLWDLQKGGFIEE